MESASLLTGLLYDGEGNRFTPSHTVKSGRRYRYYICHPKSGDDNGTQCGTIRLPAYEIEAGILSRLRSLFESQNELLNQLGTPDGVETIQSVFKAAEDALQVLKRGSGRELSELYEYG